MTVEFTIPGAPQGKGRPRFSTAGGFVKTYTPAQTASYENLVKLEYERQVGKRFDDGAAISMHIRAYFDIPKSVSKKKREQMLNGEIRPTKKPDADNILKIIADSLNGVAYKDDSQIVYCAVRKAYSDEPRVTVRIADWKEVRDG